MSSWPSRKAIKICMEGQVVILYTQDVNRVKRGDSFQYVASDRFLKVGGTKQVNLPCKSPELYMEYLL